VAGRGGNTIVAVFYGLCLLTCLLAFGNSLSLWTVLVINIGIGTLASLVPIRRGCDGVRRPSKVRR